jgi:tetratricopeptide (TPR) repeat protein
MITINESLAWLNQFDKSHLRRSTKSLLRHLQSRYIPEYKRRQMISTAIRSSRLNGDPFELAEVMLHCAVEEYKQKDFAIARDFASAAAQIYPPESHPAVVAYWIQGTIYHEISNSLLQYSCWYHARNIFEGLKAQAGDLQNLAMTHWYTVSLEKINVAMLYLVEEPYTWLDRFEASHLSMEARILHEKIIQELEEKRSDNIQDTIFALQSLGENSADPMETAETLVECGYVAYRIGDAEKALSLLQSATNAFQPASLQQASAQWMLGVLEWQLENRELARESWENSIHTLEELIRGEDNNLQQEQLAWCNNKVGYMTTALKRKVAGADSSRDC